MVPQYNRSLNGNTRLQSGLGRVQEFQPAQADTLIMAEVLKVNFIYNTVDLVTVKAKERLVKGQAGNGKFSAKLPVNFGGSFQTGNSYGTRYPIAIGDTVLVGFLDKNKNTPIVLGIYETQDIASELAPTDAISGDPESPDVLPEAMSHFTLFPSQTYREVNGDGYIEDTFPGKSFLKLTSGQAGRFKLNDSTYSYSNLARYKLRGRDVTPTAIKAPQILFQHVGAGSRYINNVFFDEDGTFRISKTTSFDNERIDAQSGNTKDFYFRYQNDKRKANDDTSSVISEVGIKDGVPILRLNDHILTIDKDKGIMVDGSELKDYVSGAGSDLQKIVDQLVKGMKQVKGDLTQFEIDIRKELAEKATEIYTYIDAKIIEQNTDLSAIRQSIEDLTNALNIVKGTADATAKTVSDATGSDASLQARLNRMDNALTDLNPYLQEIKNARKDNITNVTSASLGARLDLMSKYMQDLNPKILDNASAISAMNTKHDKDIANLTTKLANEMVHRTGTETVAGLKTFTESVTMPSIELKGTDRAQIDFHGVNTADDFSSRLLDKGTGLLAISNLASTHIQDLSIHLGSDEKPVNVDTLFGGIPTLEGNPGIHVRIVFGGGTKPYTGTIPGESMVYSVLENLGGDASAVRAQRWTSFLTNRTFTRTYSGNPAKWSAWKTIAYSEDVVHTTGNEPIAGNKTFTGTTSMAGASVHQIELEATDSPYIDFHAKKSTAEYTSRLIDTGYGLRSVAVGAPDYSVSMHKGTDAAPVNVDTMIGGTPSIGGVTVNSKVVFAGGTKPFTGTAPVTTINYSVLEHLAPSGANAIQRWTDTNSGKIYSRVMNSSKWTAWSEVGAGGSNFVTLDTAQTIIGAKTFSKDVESAGNVMAGTGFTGSYNMNALNTIQYPFQMRNNTGTNVQGAIIRALRTDATQDSAYGFGSGGLGVYGSGEATINYFNMLSAKTIPSGLPASSGNESAIITADEHVWIIPGMQTPATGIKSDAIYFFSNVGNFGKRIGEKNTYLINKNGTWIGLATPIPANADLNTYLTPGEFSVNMDKDAKTLKNYPTNPSTQMGAAFTLTVTQSNPAGESYQTLRNYHGWVWTRAYYSGNWTRWVAIAGSMSTNVTGPWSSTINLARTGNMVMARIVNMQGAITGGTSSTEKIPLDYIPLKTQAGNRNIPEATLEAIYSNQSLTVEPNGTLKNWGGGSFQDTGVGQWMIVNE